MPESTTHREIAERIAKRDRAKYDSARGPDVRAPGRVTEVGIDPARVREEMAQVARFRNRARYVAGPAPFVTAAKKATKGTGIGVRDARGRIVKRAGGKKK